MHLEKHQRLQSSTNESWTGTSNYSNTSGNRELSGSCSGRGSASRGDYPVFKGSESMCTSGREREMQQLKPRSVSVPETAARTSRGAGPLELSPRIAPEISMAPPAVVPQPVPKSNETEKIWHYKDPSGRVQGPFSMAQLCKWNNSGYFPAKLEVWKTMESPWDSILLTDAMAGIFQKQTQSVDSSYMKAQVAAYCGQSSQHLGQPQAPPNTSGNRELSRSYSGSSEDESSESEWTAGREREMQQSLGSEKPRSVSIPETVAPLAYSGQSSQFELVTPSVLPSQSQSGFPQSDSWRVHVPSQSITQAQAAANNSSWGMNSRQPQAPANFNWAASSTPSTGQSWPVQAQSNACQNRGGAGQSQSQAEGLAQVQGGSSTGLRLMQSSPMVQPQSNMSNRRVNNVQVFWDLNKVPLPALNNNDQLIENIQKALRCYDPSFLVTRVSFYGIEDDNNPLVRSDRVHFYRAPERYWLCNHCIHKAESVSIKMKIDRLFLYTHCETAATMLTRGVYKHARRNFRPHQEKHILVITPDVDFCWMIADLIKLDYKVMVGQRPGADQELQKVSLAAWNLSALLRGETYMPPLN
ncbi:hypothetical protein AALP_AAs40419U000100 [Arabis alpina]|uniref:GYF domain-containing protein n=1 Tax=Arabis alpina TaxID=50452 RepID=A0A087FWC4_ARAAL|nr:hypothetical protein AALP_AAs40419U000100 [Arabis alpina]